MIQGVPKSTLDVDMNCPRSMSKVTYQECAGNNYRQKHRTATASMDAQESTCTDASGIPCTDTQTCVSTSKDVYRSMCTDDLGSARTDVSTESIGVRGSTCPWIYIKGAVVRGVTSTDDSTVKMVIHGRTNTYGEYRRYEPIYDIGTDVVWKVRKGIRYDDAL